MNEQYIGCQSCDDIIICDSTKRECCIPLRGIFIVIDLEKHVNGKLLLNPYFSYAEDHADFLIIKLKKDENMEEKVVLEIIEFKNIKIKSDEDLEKIKQEEIKQILQHGILFQLLYFYVKIKNLLDNLKSLSKGKINLCDFSDINNIELKIVVPQGVDQLAREIKNDLKRDYNKVLKDFLSNPTPFFQRSSNTKQKIDEVKKLIGTNKAIIDKINIVTCKNLAIES